MARAAAPPAGKSGRRAPRPVDPEPLLRQLITPEGLDLRLTLASAGERAGAFLLDALIMLAVLIGLTIATVVAHSSVGKASTDPLAVIWLLGAFCLRNGYFTLFELSRRAATPGKRLLGLRVIARDGGPLTAEAILVRNALREIEVFLPLNLLAASAFVGDQTEASAVLLGLAWAGLFLVFPLFNRDRLRLGDMAAGTWVVRAPRASLLPDLAVDAAEALPRFAFTAEQAGAYGVKELEILADVLRRRDAKTMADVARRIRARIAFVQPPGETDEAFLKAYYAALRARLEHRLLFGHRRRDKFDAA